MGAKVEYPIGKKLFHLVVNPGTSRCPTVKLELVETTRNVNGTRHSVRKFQPGKRAHLFRFSTFSGNFPVGWTDETCSIYRRTRNSGNFDKMESAHCFGGPEPRWRLVSRHFRKIKFERKFEAVVQTNTKKATNFGLSLFTAESATKSY